MAFCVDKVVGLAGRISRALSGAVKRKVTVESVGICQAGCVLHLAGEVDWICGQMTWPLTKLRGSDLVVKWSFFSEHPRKTQPRRRRVRFFNIRIANENFSGLDDK